jgi:hypothetical protein
MQEAPSREEAAGERDQQTYTKDSEGFGGFLREENAF